MDVEEYLRSARVADAALRILPDLKKAPGPPVLEITRFYLKSSYTHGSAHAPCICRLVFFGILQNRSVTSNF